MKDLPDHVNRHRPLRPHELPRHYRRIRFADADTLARERELDPEHRYEFDDDFWDPWIGTYASPDDDYFSSREMLRRIAWELVFESGTSIATVVPPEKWARMEALLPDRQSPGSRSGALPRSKPDSVALALRLKDRLKFVREEHDKVCCDLLRAEM